MDENEYRRLMDAGVLGGSADQSVTEAWDAGAYNKLQMDLRVATAGSAGTLKLQHAPVNEDKAYEDLSGASVNLNATGSTFVTVSDFWRFVRWSYSGATGNPVALIDGIAKK